MRRPWLAIFLAIAGLAGGIIGFTLYAHENESPFSFGEARPGVEFAEMDDDSQRNQGRRFSCTPIAGSYRVCEVTTDGPPGRMRVAVDAEGRVIVVDMTINEVSPKVAALSDQVRKQWDRVGGVGVRRTTGVQQTLDWRAAEGRWSASMRMRSLALGMERIAIADERALARLDGSDQRLLMTTVELVRRGLVDDSLLTAVERRAPGTLLRAANARSADARRWSATMRTLSRCRPDPVPVVDYVAADDLLGEHAAIVQQAVGVAYNGRRIIVADQPYLVDANDVGEPISITTPTEDRAGGRIAFAISYTGRADTSTTALERGQRPRLCRATSDVLIARVDPALRTTAEVRFGELEPDGWVTRAKSLEFVTADDATQLVASYESTYADTAWWGSVTWEATLSGDSLVALARRPLAFTKTGAGRTMGGLIVPDTSAGRASRDDPDPFSGRLVLVMPAGDDTTGAAPFSLVLPSAVNGTPNGWTLLAMF